jgi:hypothetical protein
MYVVTASNAGVNMTGHVKITIMVAGQRPILPDWEDASAMPTGAIDNSRPQSTVHDLDLDRIPSKIAFNSIISGLFFRESFFL